jgi:hypothetical protein
MRHLVLAIATAPSFPQQTSSHDRDSGRSLAGARAGNDTRAVPHRR